MIWAIAVHGGAGNWDEAHHERARAGVSAAAQQGGTLLAQGGSALDAVTAAVAVLEDDPLFNAGTGSVLNRDGEVEMDASRDDRPRSRFRRSGGDPARAQSRARGPAGDGTQWPCVASGRGRRPLRARAWLRRLRSDHGGGALRISARARGSCARDGWRGRVGWRRAAGGGHFHRRDTPQASRPRRRHAVTRSGHLRHARRGRVGDRQG